MKVVINRTIGGFHVSQKLFDELCALGQPDALERGKDLEEGGFFWSGWGMERHDPRLVEAVERLGDKDLKVVEIPDGVEYVIVTHDQGTEHIAEKHRTMAVDQFGSPVYAARWIDEGARELSVIALTFGRARLVIVKQGDIGYEDGW